MLLKFVYQDFMDEQEFRNLSEANKKNHRQLLKPFIDDCIKQGIVNVEDISTTTVKRYLTESQRNGNKPGTINTKLMRIRTFLNFCVEERIITKNPALKIKRVKEDVKIEVFSDLQVNQMLAYILN